MELKPTSHNVASRDRRVEVWGKFERQATDAARRMTQEVVSNPEQTEVARELRARYESMVNELRRAAVELDPSKLSSQDAECHHATQTEWCSFASADYSEDSLVPECRYTYRDVTVAKNDNHLHRFTVRNQHESIEVRWRDDTREYIGEPELLALIHPSGVIVFEEDEEVRITLDSENPSEQFALDDFLSTIAEPLVAKLRAQELANQTLPIDEPEITA